MANNMNILKKFRIGIFFVAVLAGIGVYALVDGIRFVSAVPEDFARSRQAGALISQDIVTLTGSISTDLAAINELDKEGKYEEAMTLAKTAIDRSREVRAKAVDLSKEMETMARLLPDIKSDTAREAAMQAISNRLVLIARLINYSTYLNNLLLTLQDKFKVGYTITPVAPIISQINGEVVAINEFNKNASAAMEKFDAIVAGQQK
jgi:hypothetical protein